VGLTTLPLPCANCLEIWEPQPPGSLRACPGVYRDCFTFTLTENNKFFAILYSVYWQFATDVSVQAIGPVLKGQTTQEGSIPY
jgi:hypothetical protein